MGKWLEEKARDKVVCSVADGGETFEGKNSGDGGTRGTAEDKSFERGHAKDGRIASVTFGTSSSGKCKWSSSGISREILKRWRVKKEGRVYVCSSNYFY